jgi:hypothetical protein
MGWKDIAGNGSQQARLFLLPSFAAAKLGLQGMPIPLFAMAGLLNGRPFLEKIVLTAIDATWHSQLE